MTDRQPDFVIVGATKSATTWLQRNLQQHSAVFMPGTETHYFSWHFGRGPAWYGTFFTPAAAHQIVGEKSTSYLDHPEAAQRLHEVMPEVRVIMHLRNPIERVWAHYCMDSRHGGISTDAEHDLGDGGTDDERLRAGGLYFRHVSRFFELFPQEQLCVTLYDDLDRDPASVLNRIRAHVGLATASPEIGPEVAQIARTPSEQSVGDPGPGVDRRRDPGRARPGRYPKLSRATRKNLCSYYQDDVRALSRLLGRDLSAWLGTAGSR
jgi:Sulfotransferase domain